jgi:CheY-like chemotaxis protein
LLVDSNARSRESRAKVMRTLGTIVHCASNARAAHSRFEAGPYNLVLVDLGADIEGAEQLAQGIRSKKPGQLVGFLVGSPLFVAKSLKQKANRPPQVPAVSAVPIQKTTMPARMVVDFGQKIRDAEAEQVLDDIA